ncbi:hypothetical protein NDU88_013246 [Pleurodeles waltl]|uniref:Uncharacterized protein n=1 Tax=Pleurodeles waltl TaxID=8319 RepID=A0AAV7R674_PLEWA|nr:hypothetical protein NDU88_013246 [Pleurodeles waltl]
MPQATPCPSTPSLHPQVREMDILDWVYKECLLLTRASPGLAQALFSPSRGTPPADLSLSARRLQSQCQGTSVPRDLSLSAKGPQCKETADSVPRDLSLSANRPQCQGTSVHRDFSAKRLQPQCVETSVPTDLRISG